MADAIALEPSLPAPVPPGPDGRRVRRGGTTWFVLTKVGASLLSLLFIAIFTFGTWVLTGVVDEKQSRVVEVVLATMDPRVRWNLDFHRRRVRAPDRRADRVLHAHQVP